RIIELRALADHDRARADEQDAPEVSPLGHRARPAGCRSGRSAAPSRWRPAAWTRRPRGEARRRHASDPDPPPEWAESRPWWPRDRTARRVTRPAPTRHCTSRPAVLLPAGGRMYPRRLARAGTPDRARDCPPSPPATRHD